MNRSVFRLGAVCLVSVLLVFLLAGFAEASTNYTVQRGDSLYLIANKFGVSVSAIKSANGLSGDKIYPGQSLVIPGGDTKYTVVKGDTLFLISKRFGVSIDSIRKANNLWKDMIYPGQVLIIPGGSSRQTTTASRGYSRKDLDLLAKVVYAEARGEVYAGQVGVAAVVLNRVRHPNFPDSIPGVIYQPWEFTCVNDGQINLAPNQTAYKAVQDAVNGWDPTYGALYYWNPAKAQSKWVWSRKVTTQIGNHMFAK